MPIHSAQFYFTEVDPDYSIKGSRDPLGFQVLWQEQARQLIPFLSTVSINLRDFQVMCLAYHLYERAPDNNFIKFFLRLEQLMAYARYDMNDRAFNGLRKVGRLFMEEKPLRVSNSKQDEILSNQRAYGIWGKYSRPFREMGFLKREEFPFIFSDKIARHPERATFMKLINAIKDKAELKITPEHLQLVQPILLYTEEEKQFYNSYILQASTSNNYQSLLYQFLQEEGEASFEFYAFLQAFKSSAYAQQAGLTDILTDIEETEKILCPLNRIFRLLQTRPLWTKGEIAGEEKIEQCKRQSQFTFSSASKESISKNKLSATLQKGNWELVMDLVERNKTVTTQRGGAPWLTLSGEVVEVHHREGGSYDPHYDPNINVDNRYFIDTYVSLYNQITQG